MNVSKNFFLKYDHNFQPISNEGNWPWCSKEENGTADKRFRYTLTSLSNPKRCIGFARRRMGRGGRVILDRITTDFDDYWRKLDYTIFDPHSKKETNVATVVSDHKLDNLMNSNTDGSPARAVNLVSGIRTEIKAEVVNRNNFSSSENNGESVVSDSRCVVKQEPIEISEEFSIPNVDNSSAVKDDLDDMVETLKMVQRDW